MRRLIVFTGLIVMSGCMPKVVLDRHEHTTQIENEKKIEESDKRLKHLEKYRDLLHEILIEE